MTPTDKHLVQDSLARLLPQAEPFAELFYHRLFSLDPELQPLFQGNMQHQGSKLIHALRMAVAGLDDPAALQPTLAELARGHLPYGVKEEHYATVGAALLWALKRGLGNDFESHLEAAWVSAYQLIAGLMIDAAYRDNDLR